MTLLAKLSSCLAIATVMATSSACSTAQFTDYAPDVGVRADASASMECLPRERRCLSDTEAQECSDLGRWNAPTSCAESRCERGRCNGYCGDGCIVGELGCAGDAPQRCELDEQGCSRWRIGSTCPPDTPCVNGACTCASKCMVGEVLCAGEGASRRCQSSGCWTAPEPCAASEVCIGGVCQVAGSPCSDQCREEQVVCVSEYAYQPCERQANGCLDFSTSVQCPAGMSCDPDQRCRSAICENIVCAIGETRCDQNAIQICEPDRSGCPSWGRRVSCDTNEICQDGSCDYQCDPVCQLGTVRCADAGEIERCEQVNGCANWSYSGRCEADQVCLPGGRCGQCAEGQTNNRSCGGCGLQHQTCIGGRWSAWSDCPVGCTPGTERVCGNCGIQICDEACEWTSCLGEGPCARGALELCGECGQRQCGNDCEWLSECNNGDGTTFRACRDCGWQFCCPEGDWCTCEGRFEDRCSPLACGTDGFCSD